MWCLDHKINAQKWMFKNNITTVGIKFKFCEYLIYLAIMKWILLTTFGENQIKSVSSTVVNVSETAGLRWQVLHKCHCLIRFYHDSCLPKWLMEWSFVWFTINISGHNLAKVTPCYLKITIQYCYYHVLSKTIKWLIYNCPMDYLKTNKILYKY